MREGDNVYYTEHGKADTGVIVAVVGGKTPYTVSWDNGDEVDSYSEDQLTFLSSPANFTGF